MTKPEISEEKQIVVRPQVNYRKLDALNQSMLSTFDSDPVKFYEEFKLGKPRKQKENIAYTIGDMVDFYILDCGGDEDVFNNRFDEKFALSEGKIGSGQVFTLARTLYKITMDHMNEDGEVSTSFDTRFTEAANQMKAKDLYKGKSEDKMLEDFNKNGLEYFETLIENTGKTVVDESLIDKSVKISKMILNDNFTSDIFVETDDIEYLPKFPIEWIYKTKNGTLVPCKSEIDILKVDHKARIIYLKDLKTTYDNEGFEFNYIKNSYYLQAAFYYKAVEYWSKLQGMGDYEIRLMEFVVGDTSANNRRPIRYQTSMDDLVAGLSGFSFRGTKYRGVDELIEEIMWCERTNTWDCSKIVYDNKGKLKLSITYDE